MQVDIEVDLPSDTNRQGGLAGFLQTLAGYYRNFLETDFKAASLPKRRFERHDRAKNRTGTSLDRYDSFRTLITNKLDQKTPPDFVVSIGRHKSSLSATLRASMVSAIEAAKFEQLAVRSNKLRAQLTEKLPNPQADIEKLAEQAEAALISILRADVVDPVLEMISPAMERNLSSGEALERLLSYSDEIAQFLAGSALTILPSAIAELAKGPESPAYDELHEVALAPEALREGLQEYFADFALSDVFTELREILTSQTLIENSQIYLNVGEVHYKDHHFPLYYIPLTLETEKEGIRINFDSHLFVNKRAVDYIVGVLSKTTEQVQASPLAERIFYKGEEETYLEVIDQTLHKILAALRIQGEVGFETAGKQVGEGPGYKVSNTLSISLADKSDESIVNDYEALMTGLDGGSALVEAFAALVNSFMTENPLSLEAPVSQEWIETDLPTRLVFESPLPLAEEQRKILSAIRHPESRFVLVEGPPGTGKSHTIAAIAFEMILEGKNILILSDKTEALDVAESKINQVLKRVRGNTDFINPILRLGKSGSNYSNIIKGTTISKLKAANEAFMSNRPTFIAAQKAKSEVLNKGVNETLTAAADVKMAEIVDLIQLEARFYDEHPELVNIDADQHRALGVVGNVVDLLVSKRELFDRLFDSTYTDSSLSSLLSIWQLSSRDVSELIRVAEQYTGAESTKLQGLGDVADEIEALKRPLIGYLGRGKALKAYEDDIKEVLGKRLVRPHKNLASLRSLGKAGENWLSTVQSCRIVANNVDLAWRYIALGAPLTEEDFGVIEAYLDLNLAWARDLGYPLGAGEIGKLMPGDGSWLWELFTLLKKESEIAEAFDEFPEFDYLREKTQYEAFAAQKLAAGIDARAVQFATEFRNDAKTLQKVIRAKGKFPVEAFEKLRNSFPCMIAGLRDFAEFIPLEQGLFDLVIIDEASQVSIAQALPAILRAKKMLVMGDRRQFGNVKTANASKAINNAYFSEVKKAFEASMGRLDAGQLAKCNVLNISNSVMDFFEMTSNHASQLRKHFRGYPEHISFSSKYFYDGSLQALKIRGRPAEDIIQFIENPEPDSFELVKNANEWEADTIFNELESLLELDDPPSACIITPFREQQTYLSSRLSDHGRREDLRKRLHLAVYTFDTCQGEERDVVFYSMVATRDHDRLNYIFPPDIHDAKEDDLDGKLRFQRLNVGFSRVKERMVFVLSKPREEFVGSIRQVLTHYSQVLDGAQAMPTSDDVDQNSPMEAKLLGWLKQTQFVQNHQTGLEIIPQFDLGAYIRSLDPLYKHPDYKVDFLLRMTQEHGEVTQVILEYDGFQYHFLQDQRVDAGNWQEYLTPADVERQFVLESYGYKMLRVNRFTLGDDPVETLNERLASLFEELANRDEQDQALSTIQKQTDTDLQMLQDGSGKRCSKCRKVLPKKEFFDASLASKYGRNCRSCKRRRRSW